MKYLQFFKNLWLKATWKQRIIAIGALLALAAIGSLIPQPPEPEPTPKTQASTEEPEPEPEKEAVFNSELDGSVQQVRDYLKSHLNDRDSYEEVEWGNVIKVSTPKHEYLVRHKYRAANGFGAKILKNQTFYLDKKGNVVGVQDLR